MEIEKFISYQIDNQFPAIYREDGPELVAFLKEYYLFLETQPNQSTYNSRRMFEFRDIDNTYENMLLYFKNKYLQDLPFDQTTIRFITKHILDLYRRRGTKESIYLFFKMFYQENAQIYYPSNAILRPSSSQWTVSKYVQLYPTDLNSLKGLSGKKITGSISGAEAIVDKVVFVILNNNFVPILYLNNIRGTFAGFDDILSRINSEVVNYGKIYGSLEAVDIDKGYSGLTGKKIGDELYLQTDTGIGGKTKVTEVSTVFTGEIEYFFDDLSGYGGYGGYGYTREHTQLLVSNQIIFLDNVDRNFIPFERIRDSANNYGTVIGQNDVAVGVKMDGNTYLTANTTITLLDRSPLEYISNINVTQRNSSSPGTLYPDAVEAMANTVGTVQLDEMLYSSNVSLILDVVGNFANVHLDFSDYQIYHAMSGPASPVNINTALNDAFNLEPFQIGSIKSFKNVNPGNNYINEVFAIAYDPVMASFHRYNQIITLSEFSSLFAPDRIISQGSKYGKIVSAQDNTIHVIPYSYEGFDLNADINIGGKDFTPTAIIRDYGSKVLGNNAKVVTKTDAAVGKVLGITVTNSGYGYIDGTPAKLVDINGNVVTQGTIHARGQGFKEGTWTTLDSHLNYKSGKVLQDSYYYQQYSYEIGSGLDINTYEKFLKDTVHVAGTKLFGKFVYKDVTDVSTNITSFIETNITE